MDILCVRIDTFADFVSSSEQSQERYVDSLSPHEATALTNQCKASDEFAELEYCHRQRIYARLLVQAKPSEYLDSEQDRDLRKSLTPKALARLREETYDTQVRPLLVDTPENQLKLIASLNPYDRRGLKELLNRYANQYGRSHRCRELETLIGEYRD